MTTKKKKTEAQLAKVDDVGIVVAKSSSLVTQALTGIAAALSRDLTPPVLAEVFVAVKTWEDNLKDLAINARARLMKLLEEKGEVVTDSGTRRLVTEGWQLEIRPQKGGLNPKRVEALLRAKKYDPSTYMDAEIHYKLNPVKLLAATQSGIITEAELESCENEQTFALQRPKRIDNE